MNYALVLSFGFLIGYLIGAWSRSHKKSEPLMFSEKLSKRHRL